MAVECTSQHLAVCRMNMLHVGCTRGVLNDVNVSGGVKIGNNDIVIELMGLIKINYFKR
jgi:hypothetical protein